MRILHIARSDARNGKDSAARILHEELLKRGVDSELWVFEQTSREPGVHGFARDEKRPGVVLRDQELKQLLHGRKTEDFDLIHLHGLGRSLPPALLPVLRSQRLVWSLEDCSPYTGGCTHSAHCDRWEAEKDMACQECPVYSGNEKNQAIQARVYQQKKEVYGRIQLEFLCQNSWQQEQLSHSIAASQKAQVLPDMLNREAFHPGDRREVRQLLGLPENSFVLVMHTDIPDGRDRVMDYLRSVLQSIRPLYMGYVVLVAVGSVPLQGEWYVDEIRNVKPAMDGDVLLGAYYRAANLQLYFAGTDSVYRPVREAGLCALPSAVFRLGASETILSEDNGYLLPPFDEERLSGILLDGLRDAAVMAEKGMKLYVELRSQDSLGEYLGLCGVEVPVEAATEDFEEIFRSGPDAARNFLAKRTAVWNESEQDTPLQKQQKLEQKRMLVNRFCLQWLKSLQPEDRTGIWELVGVWTRALKLTETTMFIRMDDQKLALDFALELRRFLVRYFLCTPQAAFKQLPRIYLSWIASLWYFLFTNAHSVLNRLQPRFALPDELRKQIEGQEAYPKFFLQSMFLPGAPASELSVDAGKLLIDEKLPTSLRIISSFWLITAPFFNGTLGQQKSVLRHIEEISLLMAKKPDYFSAGMRVMLMERIMQSLWRASYLGGNTIRTVKSYADYLQSMTRLSYKEYTKPIAPRHRQRGEKLRIGYISTNFRHQAVSIYMGNRFKYRDPDKFFVKTFFLWDGNGNGDEMTGKIKGWSDEFEEFEVEGGKNLAKVASAVKKSSLDLLIYADIGMNNTTYLLGAMHLAPVQAVLVGHGTTTGLTTIDYYVSGDHEPENAQEHYVEKIVKLPNAGADQMPPAQSERTLTREQFGIPEDAVLFISCANGLKHVASRDKLLIEILQKAPNAYILLKPFMSPGIIDWKFRERILEPARKAGVADRLKVIAPLPESGDLMALIKLADIQLDTYPYGGWTTNLEALYYHLPIVTQQGDLARSRWGARLLSSMGIQEGIAVNEQEYVDWAVRFASEPELLKRVSGQIAERAPKVLFNGAAAQPAYEDALIRMIEQKERFLRKNKHS